MSPHMEPHPVCLATAAPGEPPDRAACCWLAAVLPCLVAIRWRPAAWGPVASAVVPQGFAVVPQGFDVIHKLCCLAHSIIYAFVVTT